MKISVVITNQAPKEYLDRCLDSLFKLHLSDHSLQIFVIDYSHLPPATSWPAVRQVDLHILPASPQNSYSENTNIGLREALNSGADFVWILSSQTAVDPSALVYFIDGAKKYFEYGIFSSKIHLISDTTPPLIWYAGGLLDWNQLQLTNRGENEPDTGQFDRDLETDFVTNVSMFVRAQVFRDARLLDWRYHYLYDIADFCQRAKYHGWRMMYLWQSLVWYAPRPIDQITPSAAEYFQTRNQFLFGLRHAPLLQRLYLLSLSVKLYLSGRPWQRRAVLDYYTQNFGSGSFQN